MAQAGCRFVAGTAYGVALFAGEVPSLDVSDTHGYSQATAPISPVLFVKPRNTFLPSGGTVGLPDSIHEVEVSPAVALVFGRDVFRAGTHEALDAISGLTLAIDLSEPVSNMLRPPIREKCRDGFLPIGQKVVPLHSVRELESLALRLLIDGKCATEFRFSERLPLLGQLIADVSIYMTFRKEDVLLIASAASAPRASVGSHLCVSADGLDLLECSLAAEGVLQ